MIGCLPSYSSINQTEYTINEFLLLLSKLNKYIKKKQLWYQLAFIVCDFLN